MPDKLEKILDKQVFIETRERINLEELAIRVSSVVEHDDAATFIAFLDKLYQSWDVTQACINHFDAVKETYKQELPEEEQELEPKNLLC